MVVFAVLSLVVIAGVLLVFSASIFGPVPGAVRRRRRGRHRGRHRGWLR
jgi:hypothetical protein